MTQRPMIQRGILGIAEADVPQLGVANTACWPVIESGRRGLGGGVLASIRRHVTWYRMLPHATECEQVELVDPPRWAERRITTRRRHLGLA